MSLRYLSDQPNSHTAGTIICLEVVAIVGPHNGWGTEPGTPTKFVLGALAIVARRAVDGCARVIPMPAIFGPLKDIAEHVVETKCTGFERTAGCREHVAITT